MKLDLRTNATVVDDAFRFVSNRTNEMLRPSISATSINYFATTTTTTTIHSEYGQAIQSSSWK